MQRWVCIRFRQTGNLATHPRLSPPRPRPFLEQIRSPRHRRLPLGFVRRIEYLAFQFHIECPASFRRLVGKRGGPTQYAPTSNSSFSLKISNWMTKNSICHLLNVPPI